MKVSSRLPGLDLLRSLAVIAVIGYHYPKASDQLWLRALTHYGWAGVDLFFVLSGYLIGRQFLTLLRDQQEIHLGTFYLRRFLRTFPSYYVVFLGTLFLALFWGESFQGAWKYLFFLQNFGIPSRITVSWSICVEEHFYVFFPILAIWLARTKKSISFVGATFAALFFLGWALRLFFWLQNRPDLFVGEHPEKAFEIYLGLIYYPTTSHLDGLLVGVGLASLQVFRPQAWKWLTDRGHSFLAAGLVGIAICALTLQVQTGFFSTVFGFTILSLSFGFLLISCVSSKTFLGRQKISGAAPLALLSYALYFMHSPAIETANRLASLIGIAPFSLGYFLICLPLIFLFSTALYFCVEGPFLKIRERVIA